MKLKKFLGRNQPYSTRSIKTYRGVEAKRNFVVVGASFKVDLQMNSSNNTARILEQYDKNVWLLGGSYSNLQSGYWSDWRSPTNAWMSFDATAFGEYGSSFCWLKLYANGSKYWIENN